MQVRGGRNRIGHILELDQHAISQTLHEATTAFGSTCSHLADKPSPPVDDVSLESLHQSHRLDDINHQQSVEPDATGPTEVLAAGAFIVKSSVFGDIHILGRSTAAQAAGGPFVDRGARLRRCTDHRVEPQFTTPTNDTL
jgi:hypothetical protein